MAEEEDFSALPLPEQFAHKNWKARKGGYERACQAFSTAQPSDPLLRDFTLDTSLWKAAVADSNVAAQQDALLAYIAFLHAAGSDGARRTRSHTIQGVVEKGLLGRPAAKASAVEIILLLVELDKGEPVIDELLPLVAHKQPKVIAATLALLASVYRAYGCKTIEPKPVVKLLPKAFGHADKNVRAEAQGLTVELYRWLREAMKPLFWGELKEVQQKDLEKLFEPVKDEPLPKQERLLRSQQAAQEEAAALGDTGDDGSVGDAGEEADDAVIDLEPEYEAVDVLAKIPKDFQDRLASAKWKDRKEALDELFAAANVPAIQEGSFDDVLRGCAKSMKDANIAVVTVAANCIECIANGLRKGFSRYRGTVLAPMLERFKEKKTSVTDAISAACDAVFAATSLGEMEADVLEAMKNKNPQVKEHTAKFVIRSLSTARDAPSLEQTKELAEAGKRLLAESAATLRDVGAELLGVLWKVMGDRNMLNHLEGLEELRKNKIKEFADAAEVKAKWKPKSVAPAVKANGTPAAAGKKAAPGTRRPAGAPGLKKAAVSAPRPPSPLAVEDAPLQPRPTSRPAPKAVAGLRPPGSGLKAPSSGPQKAVSALKAPTGTASPKRLGMVFDDPAPPSLPQKLPGPGRGLAARPLGKPTAPTSPPSRQQLQQQEAVPSTPSASSSHSSALSALERQELSATRAEIDLLRAQGSELRQEKLRWSSQLAELQNANARLIEDHTRDVLMVKAKETQLVRARADAEAAEERAETLTREVERLKREMGRLGRGNAAAEVEEQTWKGDGEVAVGGRQVYGSGRSGYTATAGPKGYGDLGAGGGGDGGVSTLHGGAGQGKENEAPELRAGNGKLSAFSAPLPHLDAAVNGNASNSHLAPNGKTYNAARSNGSTSANGTPALSISDHSHQSGGAGVGGGSAEGRGSAALNRSQSEGVESWKRAAEVTQNLKARIEMMKARQNLGRGQ